MILTKLRTFAFRLSLAAVIAAMTPFPGFAAADIAKFTADATAGNAEAQLALANAYMKGDGVPADMAQGLKCCRMAAEQGLPAAQVQLGMKYKTGQGLPVDPVEADKWLVLATEGDGHYAAVLHVIEGHMDSRDVSQGHAAAQKWKAERASASTSAAAPQ